MRDESVQKDAACPDCWNVGMRIETSETGWIELSKVALEGLAAQEYRKVNERILS